MLLHALMHLGEGPEARLLTVLSRPTLQKVPQQTENARAASPKHSVVLRAKPCRAGCADADYHDDTADMHLHIRHAKSDSTL